LQELQAAYKELAQSHAELKEVAKAAVQKEAQASGLVLELSDLVKSQKAKAKKEKSALLDRFARAQEDAELLRKDNLKLEEKIARLGDRHRHSPSNLRDDLERIRSERDSLRDVVEELRDREHVLTKELEDIRSARDDENHRLNDEVHRLNEELMRKNDAYRVKEKMLDDQNDTITKLKSAAKDKVSI
jgi:leucine-rich repeat and coiled-coil domain-containing protein 1